MPVIVVRKTFVQMVIAKFEVIVKPGDPYLGKYGYGKCAYNFESPLASNHDEMLFRIKCSVCIRMFIQCREFKQGYDIAHLQFNILMTKYHVSESEYVNNSIQKAEK